jgi:hypothetical protein
MKAKLYKREDRYDLYAEDDHKIASSAPNTFGKLSKQNCDEIFRVVNVEKLAEEEYKSHASNEDLYGNSEELQLAYKAGVVDGFNKAMELNQDKVFTLEDMKKAINLSYVIGKSDETYQECEKFVCEQLQSLQQQTEIEVEIEMDILNEYDQPKLDESKCLILKKI